MFSLPDLAYSYDGLSKSISQKIMELHHNKHHQAYVDNLNKAVSQAPELEGKSLEELITQLGSVPAALRTMVRNHGGGHYNHSFFWQIMSPDGGGQPGGALLEKINASYGSFQSFVDAFSGHAAGVFGSGWAWLMPDLSMTTTPNQDNPIMNDQPSPILGLDVWEHAYYLDYTSNRADYIKAWWNVVNWPEVEKRYRDV